MGHGRESPIDCMTPGTSTAAAVDAFPEAQTASSAKGLIVEVSDNEVSENEASEGTSTQPAQSDVWAWAWLLWERRRLLARAMAWGLAISAVIAFVTPKRYESTIRLMPPDGQSGSGLALLAAMAAKSSMGTGSLAGSLLGQHNTGLLFVDILRGRTVEDGIISRFDLRKVYRKRYWVDARKRLNVNTAIEQDRKSEVITIRVTDRDPRRAAAMAQAYVDELDHLVADVSTSSARRERIFIEDRLKNVKRELDEASRQFSEFASQNATIDLSAQGKAMVEAAGRLQGELIAAQSQLPGLEQIYTSSNVRVRSLRARTEELKNQLEKMGGTQAGSDGRNSSADQAAEFPSIRQLPLLGVRWAELYRQTKIEETVYELLTQQYELAKIEEAKEIPTVKILDAADVPERKSGPPRRQIVLLGGMLSLFGAAAWTVGCVVWDQTSDGHPGKRLFCSIATSVMDSRPVQWLRPGASKSSARKGSALVRTLLRLGALCRRLDCDS
jgi:uncharacterized protein involved in exopolysaccharide biosynthesis